MDENITTAADDARDAARLDWLDGMNKALNVHYGTQYGWKLVMSPNVTRLLCGPSSAGHIADLDLHDSASGASKSTSVREAIDAAMSASTPAAKPTETNHG